MFPDDPRHGSPRGYRVHREDNEDACQPCSLAWYRYNKRATYLRETGAALRVPAIGTHRRIRALMALGYGLPTLAAELDIATGNLSKRLQQPYVVRSTHERVADLFEGLAMKPPPDGWVAERTRNIARRRGWAAPLCWDNIDDPHEEPKGMRGQQTRRSPDDLDPAMVDRLLQGRREPDATKAEKVAAMTRWLAWGRSEKSLCVMHGWHDGRYVPRERVAS